MKQKPQFYLYIFFLSCFFVLSFSFAMYAAAQTTPSPPGSPPTTTPPPACSGGKIWSFAESRCKCPTGQEDVGGKCELENPAKGQLVSIKDFGGVIEIVIRWALYFAGSIAVIFLIVGGFQYVASRGNEEAMEKAKKTITSAIIGIIVIVMAFAIVAIVNALLTTNPPR